MKRRLLAVILATVLAVSGLPQTGYAKEATEVIEDSILDEAVASEEKVENCEEAAVELTEVTVETAEATEETTEDTVETAEVMEETTEDTVETAEVMEETTEVTEDTVEVTEESAEVTEDATEVAEETVDASEVSVDEIEELVEAGTYDAESIIDLMDPKLYNYVADDKESIINLMGPKLYNYVVNDNGDAVITGYKGEDPQILIIPSELNGHKVVEIGEKAFKGLGIRTIYMSETVTVIGEEAFWGCSDLFQLYLPPNLEILGDCAFGYCTGLPEVTIPKTVKQGYLAFNGCKNLKKITVEDGITVIPEYLFGSSGCWEVELPNSVKTIGEGAFLSCKQLHKLTIPESVETIEKLAFAYSGLRSLTIPDSVTTIGDALFQECDSIRTVVFGKNIDRIPSVCFSASGIEEIIIPDTIKEIQNQAFQGCKNLKKVVLGEGLETLAWFNFIGCTSLTEIEIPYGVTYIGQGTFSNCTSLRLITICPTATYISDKAFTGVENLTIRCADDSYAHEFAVKNNIKTESLVVEPTSMTFAYKELYLYPGGLFSLDKIISSVLPGNQTYKVEWSSADPKIVSIDGYSLRGYSAGTTTLTATVGKITKKINITVLPKNIDMPEATVSGEDGKATITWNKIDKADRYVVYRHAPDDGSSFTVIGTIMAGEPLKFVDKNVEAGVEYKYVVYSWLANLSSGYRKIYQVTIKPERPVTKLSLLDNGVKVSWNEIPKATKYYVYRKEAGKSYSCLATLSSNLYYLDRTAEVGKEYYYAVKAVVNDITSGYISASVKIDLSAPTTTAKVTESGVKVGWNTVSRAEGYRLYRKEEGKSYVLLKTFKGNATTTYTDTTADGGKKYYYAVKAYAGSTTSTYISANVIVPLQTPTTKLTNTASGVKVSWNVIPGAEEYYVYRKVVGGTYEKIATVTGKNYYLDKTATPGKQYYYTVKAVANGKVSGYKSVLISVPKR